MFEKNEEFKQLADAYAVAVKSMNDWIETSGADYDAAWDVANQRVDEVLVDPTVEMKADAEEESLKKFTILFYNRFADEDQSYRIKAKSALWALRLFYMRHDRKAYHACVTSIYENTRSTYDTEADVRAYVERNRS